MLTQQQLEMQEAILLAVHKWCTLEEARKKEIKHFGCIICYDYDIDYGKKKYLLEKIYSRIIDRNEENVKDANLRRHYTDKEFRNWNDVIWLPPTLSRVLTALDSINHATYVFFNQSICPLKFANNNVNDNIRLWKLCDRKLLNDDGADATLFDQSQETQDAIHSMLCKK